MNHPHAPIAWVDESGSNSQLDPGSYIMSAALVEPLHEHAARETMRHLLLPGQLKLHWRDENPRRQHAIAAMIGTLPIEHLIVVFTHHDAASRAERRRRITLQHLLPELTLLGVERVVLESRGAANDRRDMSMLQYLRAQRLLAGQLWMDHAIGQADPLLWIPDAACGVTTALRRERLREHRAQGHASRTAHVAARVAIAAGSNALPMA